MPTIHEMIKSTNGCFDREEEKERFQKLLAGQGKPILLLHGIPGVGKSVLLREFSRLSREANHFVAWADWSNSGSDKVTLLAILRKQLIATSSKKKLAEFKNFDEALRLYLETCQKMMGINDEKLVGQLADPSMLIAIELTKNIPFAEMVLETLRGQAQKVYKSIPSEQRELVLNPETRLTLTFCEGLNKLARNYAPTQRVVLIFDQIEKLEPEQQNWLQTQLLGNLENAAIVLATHNRSPLNDWVKNHPNWRRVIDVMKIQRFTLEDAQAYLSQNEVNNNAQNTIIEITGGHPLAMATAIEWLKDNPAEASIDFGINKQLKYQMATEFFLTRLIGGEIKRFVLDVSILRRFRGDELIAIFGEDYLSRLKELPFLKYDSITNDYQFHDVVRELLRTRLRQDFPSRYQKLTKQALDYYQKSKEEEMGSNRQRSLIEWLYYELVVDEIEGIHLLQKEFNEAAALYRIGLCETLIQEALRYPLTPPYQPWAGLLQGQLYNLQNDCSRAIQQFKAILRREAAPELIFHSHVALGEAYYLQGKNQAALKVLKDALNLPKSDNLTYRSNLGLSHWHLGRIYRSQGQMELARSHLKKSAILFENNSQPYLAGYAHCTLGEVDQMIGNYSQAISRIQQSQTLLKEIEETSIYGRALHLEGRVHQLQGDWNKAQTLLKESLRLREEIKDQHGIGYSYWGLGWFYLTIGDYGKATLHLQRGLSIFKAIKGQDGIARSQRLLGEVYTQLGHWDEAYRMFTEALAIQEKRQGLYEKGLITRDLGELARLQSNWNDAQRYNTESYRIMKLCQSNRVKLEIMVNQAKLEANQGHAAELRALLTRVWTPLSESEYSDLIAIVKVLSGIYELLMGNYHQALRIITQGCVSVANFHPNTLSQVVLSIVLGLRFVEKREGNKQATEIHQKLLAGWKANELSQKARSSFALLSNMNL